MIVLHIANIGHLSYLWGEASTSAANARWPKRLGNLTLWRSGPPFIKEMEGYYGRTSCRAEELGEKLWAED